MNVTELFCDIDDFCQSFLPIWFAKLLKDGEKKRLRRSKLSESEIMTILVLFQQSGYRNFKRFYHDQVMLHMSTEFPEIVSYPRFIALSSRVLMPLLAFLQTRYGKCSGISFIDSTALRVCHNKRVPKHRVFAQSARRGKTTMGWFYGFKLHFAINDQGELLACHLSQGNVDDRKPVPALADNLWGKLFGDKGYLSKSLTTALLEKNVQLITSIRKNMKPQIMSEIDRLLLRKRSIIETIIDQLKNTAQVEHSRHRSLTGFMSNVICALISYCYQPKKPALQFANSSLLPLVIHN